MKKISRQRPKRKLERLLMWVLATLIVVNLLLLLLVQDSYLRLDWIHHSLPAISLDAVRVDNLSFIRDLVQSEKNRASAQVSIQSPTLIEPSVTSMEGFAIDTSNTATLTPRPLEPNTSPSSTEITAHTSTENPTFTPTPAPTNTPPQTTATPSTTAASVSTYFVAPNGDDSNPGTQSQPWRTIQKAANTMVAGNITIVLAGNYAERVFVNQSGVPGAPITFKTEGTVTMKGFTVSANHITIQGFDITDTDNNWSEGWGIFVQGSYCVLENNYIYFATRGGILLYANEGDDPITSNCVVRDNRLHRNSQVGLEVQGRNNLIEGNEIWRTIQYHPKWTDPPDWVDADGIRFFGSGHTIRKNYIHDITYDDPENVNPHIDCFQTWGNDAGHNVIFEQNICELLESQATDENGHGFMLADARDIIIRNNIIQAYGGVNTGGGGNSHLTIVNNVFANDLGFQSFYPIGIGLENCPKTNVKNNIFYNQPYHTISVTGNKGGQEIDYNLAYRSDGQPSRCYQIDYQCVDPAPKHDLWNVDPLFVNPAAGNFHLRGSSPAIDAGIALAEVTNDFDGNARPQGAGYDIGAFEHSAQ
jgi:hypothetical protein